MRMMIQLHDWTARCARPLTLGLLIAGTLSGTALTAATMTHQGPDWEGDLINDAGDKPSTAQKVVIDPFTQVKTIKGELSGDSGGLAGDGFGDYQDCYEVVIQTPGEFEINTLPPIGGAQFDSMLAVYDLRGKALLANIDGEPGQTGSRVGNQSTGGKFVIKTPGAILISISGSQSRPTTVGGDPVFSFTDNPLDVVGPTAIGQETPFGAWDQPGQTGEYLIELNAVAPVPSGCAVESTLSCFQIHSTPFCDNSSCCEATCAVEPFCCEVSWDATCVQTALFLCGNGGDGCGAKDAESCLVPHAEPFCSDPVCCARVCELKPFCCETEWDASCVELAETICPAPCNTICPADLDFDGEVGASDLAIMLGEWLQSGCADLDQSGSVDGADITILLGSWGFCTKG